MSLSFVDVSRSFGVQEALIHLSLDCPPGVMTCLVGPNGAGKSTALALAAGLLTPTTGRVVVDAREIDSKSPPLSTGYLPQHSSFHRSLLVGEVVDFAVAARHASSDDLEDVLEVTGIFEVTGRLVGELSGGWLRRLGLLSALLSTPRLLLLDEPFVGLDPETHDRLLVHLEERLGAGDTVVLASHDFEAIDPFSPRVAVFDEGRLVSIEDLPRAGGDSSRAAYRRALGGEPALAATGVG